MCTTTKSYALEIELNTAVVLHPVKINRFYEHENVYYF